MDFIIARIKEPSTWVGMGIIGTAAGLPAGTIDAVHMIVGGIMALVGIFLPEKAA
jgi:hypothetical protein